MSDAEKRKPNVTYNAPVGSVDMVAFKEDGTSHEIRPCPDCLPWYAELAQVEGELLVREWHAYDCPLFQDLIKD